MESTQKKRQPTLVGAFSFGSPEVRQETVMLYEKMITGFDYFFSRTVPLRKPSTDFMFLMSR